MKIINGPGIVPGSVNIGDVPFGAVFTGRFRSLHAVWMMPMNYSRNDGMNQIVCLTNSQVFWGVQPTESVGDYIVHPEATLMLRSGL